MPSVSNPMQQAVFRGCVECIRMLVENPPYYSVDACCGADGLRPIHIAAREGHIQTLRFLSVAGACLQKGDLGGCTALHHASAAGQLRAVRWLIRHGAKVLLDKRGRSPVQVAAEHDYLEIVNVLAKHTASNSTENCGESGKYCEARTNRRDSGEDKDGSDFTAGSDDYSFSPNTAHRQGNHKPFSHLHSEDAVSKISTSPSGDCASSSGNSSLSVSTSAPSLSPSASSSSAVSCGCSTSDETTLVKSVADVSDTFTLEDFQPSGNYESENSIISSPSPFYLHPPSKDSLSVNSQRIDFGTSAECGKGILKNAGHKRQNSTVLSSNSPFFLHPPENLVSETQKAVIGKMVPAPVNSSHTHLHFADPCHDAPPKLKVGLAESSASSSSSSPPQTPPGTKSGMSSTISECISKFQENGSRKSALPPPPPPPAINGSNKTQGFGADVKHKNQVNNGFIPPPPPPPPPFPGSTPMKSALPKIPTKEVKHVTINTTVRVEKAAEIEPENDYEDIDEITNGKTYDQTRKLLRSVSAPSPTGEGNHNGIGEKSEDRHQLPAPPQVSEKSQNKPSLVGGKVPFIPPHFPTPPQDALIKPSEYLRSIQNNKGKGNNGTNGGGSAQTNGVTGAGHRPSSRVEETIKALGGHPLQDSQTGGLMSPVPEETNVEDEFEEFNPERINGFVKTNGEVHSTNSATNNDPVDENNNNCSPTSTATKGGCGGMIKPEELMKVHLRKTPMSRTKSAPLLGRVLPDEPHNEDEQDENKNSAETNGHEPLKRTNTMSPLSNGASDPSALTKADVIAELAQSSQVGGVREWKEELKRRQKEQEKAVQKEIEQFYQPVPSTDGTGAPIPDWKRQMLAKKAAERARKEAEEQRRLEIEAKRVAAIPMWRRQLLQRRESDAKYAQ